MGMTAVVAFCRMNPPTKGHEQLFRKVKEVAETVGSDYGKVFLSSKQDKTNNPLSHSEKIKYIQLLLPKLGRMINTNKSVFDIISMAKFIESIGYTELVVVCGSDRVSEFKNRLNKYNGIEYNFNSISIKTSGNRDPDSNDVSGISGTKMRQWAIKGNDTEFKANLAGNASESIRQQVLMAVLNGMQLKEHLLIENVPNLDHGKNKRRYAMPQIEDNDKYLNWLKKEHDISSSKKKVKTIKLFPTQKEFNSEKIDKIIESKGYIGKPILVSKDFYILDGHHRWAAAHKDAKEIEVIQILDSIDNILKVTKEYKYVKNKSLSEEPATNKIMPFSKFIKEDKNKPDDEYDEETKTKVEIGKKKTKVKFNPSREDL
tara:strand:- start:1915 stop:3033 length:1119 start_codon:yes stop_codon:yes gene_type:complete